MAAQQKENKLYRAALYLRLSKDDEGSGESASISTQRDILRAYALANRITVVDEYVDDGFSGTNFDRPDFRRMIADIERDRVNCVITKDLSRLGRNISKTAELLEEYFPKRGTRYIAIGEGYDSAFLSNGTAFATPFMLLVYESYARDTSLKIRASFQSKMENGDFISPFAPYGYRKDPENKNHLLIDEEAARVVRAIFEMAAAGRRTSDIARELNEKQIPTPAEYRCLNHPELSIDNYSKRREWTSATLCKLLRNEVYAGHTLQGKTTKVSFKSKETRTNKREDWIVVRNTHEPIISEDLFSRVRRRAVARRCVPNRGFVNVFSGVARCADCGRNMTTAPTRKKGSTYNLCCGGYKSHGAGECSNHFIEYDSLYRIVLEELRGLLRLSEEEKAEIVSALESGETTRKSAESGRLNDLLRKQEKRLQEVSGLIKRSFELYASGVQSESTYHALAKDYEDERAGLERSIAELKDSLRPDPQRSDSFKRFFALLEEVQCPDALTPDLVHKLIDRIEVEQGHYEKDPEGKTIKRQTVRIYYRFIGCLEKTP